MPIAGMGENCLLRAQGFKTMGTKCASGCAHCGWDVEEHERRVAELHKGLLCEILDDVTGKWIAKYGDPPEGAKLPIRALTFRRTTTVWADSQSTERDTDATE